MSFNRIDYTKQNMVNLVLTFESFLSLPAKGILSLSPSKASLIVLIRFLSLWFAAFLWYTRFMGHLFLKVTIEGYSLLDRLLNFDWNNI